jgi:gamma-glutamyltranspeptidase/glutathione hydrolase
MPLTRWRLTCLVLVTTAIACGTSTTEREALPPDAAPASGTEIDSAADVAPTRQIVRSRGGVVVSQEPLATRVGVQILQQGGNAVDAAVATAFALSVVEPTNSGIGGRAQILIRHPDGTVVALDGTNEVPATYPDDVEAEHDLESGYRMIGVPGTVAALATALERHGTLPLETVIQPAVSLAERGFPLSAREAEAMARVADDLRLYEGSRRYFLRSDGTPYEGGERFVQSDLAATLRAIGQGGPDVFYRGEIAERIAADMKTNGGYVSRSDLADYRVRDALVSRTSYRGHTVIGTYLPAAGANLQAMLSMLEMATPTPLREDFPWAAILAQVLLIGFQDRLVDLAAAGPPETFPLPERLDWLLSPERLRQRVGWVRLKGPIKFTRPGGSRREVAGQGHTTHVSAVDAERRAVALTQSLGPTMGSRVATPGLGFAYSATMGFLSGSGKLSGIRALRRGDRASSRQSPTIILSPEGNLEMVLGASGSRQILSSLLQIVSRTIDHGMPFEEAVAAPRLHIEPTDGRHGFLTVEQSERIAWPDIVVARLGYFGFVVLRAERIGTVSAIHIDADGVATGVADPRKSGSAGTPHVDRAEATGTTARGETP